MHDPPAEPPGELAPLATLLDSVGAFIFAKDRAARYTYANAPLLHLLGVSLEALRGRDAGALLALAQSGDIAAHDRRVLEQGEVVEGEASAWLRGSGRRHVFWTVKRPLRDPEGRVVGLVGVCTDITERKLIEAQIDEQRQLLHVVLNSLDAFVYMKDANRRYRYINEKVAANLGVSAEQVVGKLDTEVLPRDWADQFWALDRVVFETGRTQSAEETHVGSDGRVRHHWSIKVPVRYEGVPALIGFSTDISEIVTLREQLRLQAISDGLTGLFNRRHFGELAEKELARARRHGHDTALLLLDIDGFKSINDRHGHPCGDAVLQGLARHLRDALRSEDTPARVGGEEFAVLLPRCSPMAAALAAERLRLSIANDPGLLPGGEAVTVSIGVATTGDGALRLEQLYAAADARLYAAKQSGKNRVET